MLLLCSDDFNFTGSADGAHHQTLPDARRHMFPCVWPGDQRNTVCQPGSEDSWRKLQCTGRGRFPVRTSWTIMDLRGQVRIYLVCAMIRYCLKILKIRTPGKIAVIMPPTSNKLTGILVSGCPSICVSSVQNMHIL